MESAEGRRYRMLAAKALQAAERALNADINLAYGDIASQYEALAASADRMAERDEIARRSAPLNAHGSQN